MYISLFKICITVQDILEKYSNNIYITVQDILKKYSKNF